MTAKTTTGRPTGSPPAGRLGLAACAAVAILSLVSGPDPPVGGPGALPSSGGVTGRLCWSRQPARESSSR